VIKFHAADHGYLVFDRYGDKYFLRQIWTAGNTAGLECPKTRVERETQEANNKQRPGLTELVNSILQH
jgi:hypothetical protein